MVVGEDHVKADGVFHRIKGFAFFVQNLFCFPIIFRIFASEYCRYAVNGASLSRLGSPERRDGGATFEEQ